MPWLFFSSSSTLFSKSVDKISPATFLHCGLANSTFISSTRATSFSSCCFITANSAVSCCSFFVIYSLMNFSLSLKASSKTLRIRYLTALNQLLSTLDILLLKASIRQVTLEIYDRILPERFYKQWLDQRRADQKLLADTIMPVHRPAYDRYSTLGAIRVGDSTGLCC